MWTRRWIQFLVLCLHLWVTVEGYLGVFRGDVNETITLSCNNVTELTAWFKDNNSGVVLACDGENSSDGRFSRINGSSLVITMLQIQDEGNYSCSKCSEDKSSQAYIQLKVSSGPYNVLADISPTRTLPNGTIYTSVGSNLSFGCSSNSYPAPDLEIVLQRTDANPEPFPSIKGNNFLQFNLINVASNYQGNYTCSAVNPLSGRKLNSTRQLLVYRPPITSIKCYANNSLGFSKMLLSCSWPGGYPDPLLQWEQDGKIIANESFAANTKDTLVTYLNSSSLRVRQQFQCSGKHLSTKENNMKTCQIQIDLPLLESQPMRTCFTGENVTLSCSVSGAVPSATITWLRNISDPESDIQPGKKYLISQKDSLSYLTILNCSHEEDEGYYTCKAENVLGIKEINVWLTVNKPHNIVGLVTALLLLFLLVVAIITGTVLYCDPQIYLKANPFRSGATDVLVLVDSEDEENEEVFDTAESVQYTDIVPNVPPPAANGHLSKHEVMFHRPPESTSSDLFSEVSDDTGEENQNEEI
uniref:V-set and immunoglobulin domain-containing protein 10 n=1 Tax=Xenopus laevis TaxID=8355 RepID=VSI10_XENLA|nr:RecName: Full=V-set and immunoglobulin domain-containing protein 10; Flags: Precursor [Xenopus laevis]